MLDDRGRADLESRTLRQDIEAEKESGCRKSLRHKELEEIPLTANSRGDTAAGPQARTAAPDWGMWALV